MATMADVLASVKKQRKKQAKKSAGRKALKQFKKANDPAPSAADRLDEIEEAYEAMVEFLAALDDSDTEADQLAYAQALKLVQEYRADIPETGDDATVAKVEANIRAIMAHDDAGDSLRKRAKRALRNHFGEPDTREANMLAAIALLDGEATLTEEQVKDALEAIEEGKEFLE